MILHEDYSTSLSKVKIFCPDIFQSRLRSEQIAATQMNRIRECGNGVLTCFAIFVTLAEKKQRQF